jgi:TonB family protein
VIRNQLRKPTAMSSELLTPWVAFALLATVSPAIACGNNPFYESPAQSNSSQTAPRKDPAAPTILPGHSGSIRRAVCRHEAIKVVQPVYPLEAKKAGINGDVVVEIKIDEKGRVESARALSGPDALKEAAVEASKKWKFRVTRIGGKPVRIVCALSFSFPPKNSQEKKTKKVSRVDNRV